MARPGRGPVDQARRDVDVAQHPRVRKEHVKQAAKTLIRLCQRPV